MNRTDQKKVIFRLPPEIHKQLQIKLLQENSSVQEFCEKAVLEYLKENPVPSGSRI